ncbi:MAG TPA: M28 family metallopeptidase [Trueperaceae bacterium]
MFATKDEWKALQGLASSEEVERTATDLVKWHRHSGTAGEYQAVAYLKNRLDELGIPTVVHSFEALISNPLQASLTVHAGDRRTVEVVTHPFSASAPAGVTGAVVYAGKDADASKADVAGKIAIIDGAGTPFSVNQWLSRGAIGILCHSRARVVQEYIISGVWGTPDPDSAKTLPTIPVASIDSETGDLLRRLLDESEEEVLVTLRTRLDTGVKSLEFPVAEIRGSEETDEFVLLAGHLDSWYEGAQDNAAGDAALLEVARVLQQNRSKLGRNVRIAWWVGHSQGRFSASTWYADNFYADLSRNCVGYLNLDQPGHKDATWLKTFSTPDAARFLAAMVKELSGQEVKPPRPPRNADQSFWGVGLPSFSFLPRLNDESPDEAPDEIGARKPWYQHTRFDTIDKLDFPLLAQQSGYVAVTMLELSIRRLLPWDHADTANAFRKRLNELAQESGDAIDLSPCLAAAQRLQEVGCRVRELPHDTPLSDSLNGAILRASQSLLNVYFTVRGRYHHDPAVTFPLLPGLRDVKRLAATKAGSEERLFLRTYLIRERNRVTDALLTAAEELESALPPS